MKRFLCACLFLLVCNAQAQRFVRPFNTISDMAALGNPADPNTNAVVIAPYQFWTWYKGNLDTPNGTDTLASTWPGAAAGNWKLQGGLFAGGSGGSTNIIFGNTNVIVIIVDTIANLKQLNPCFGLGEVNVRGYLTPDDGGGGDFVWLANNATPEDGLIYFTPNNMIVGCLGVWKRTYPNGKYTGVNVAAAGGIATNYTLSAVIAYAQANGGPPVIMPTGNSTIDNSSGPFDIPSGITLTGEDGWFVTFTDPTKDGFRFNGVSNSKIVGGGIQGANAGIHVIGSTNIDLTGITATNNTTSDIQFSKNGTNLNDAINWQQNNFTVITEDSGSLARNSRFDADQLRLGTLEIIHSSSQEFIFRVQPPGTNVYGQFRIRGDGTQASFAGDAITNGTVNSEVLLIAKLGEVPRLAFTSSSTVLPQTNTYGAGGVFFGNGDPNTRIASLPGSIWERRDATNSSIPSLYGVTVQSDLSAPAYTNWAPVAFVPGSDTQIPFNDGGVFGSDVDFAWDKTSNILTNNGIFKGSGSATGSSPTYGFIGSAGTGMYRSAAGIDFSIGNLTWATINSLGVTTANSSTAGLHWSTSSSDSTVLAYSGNLTLDNLNVYAFKNAATNQTVNIYASSVSSSDYSRLAIKVGGSNLATITPEASGTGTAIKIRIIYDAVNNVFDAVGTGSPEGALTAGVGSTYRRSDGGALTAFYVKETGSGNTGWVGK